MCFDFALRICTVRTLCMYYLTGVRINPSLTCNKTPHYCWRSWVHCITECVSWGKPLSTWRDWQKKTVKAKIRQTSTTKTSRLAVTRSRAEKLFCTLSLTTGREWKTGESLFLTILTFSAHVRHHRHQNKQEREIISGRIHHVFPPVLRFLSFLVVNVLGINTFPLADWNTESSAKHRLHTPSAPLATSARFCCLNLLTDGDGGAFSFGLPTRLPTPDCTDSTDCGLETVELLLPLPRSALCAGSLLFRVAPPLSAPRTAPSVGQWNTRNEMKLKVWEMLNCKLCNYVIDGLF